MNAEANTVYICPSDISPEGATIFLANITIVQKRKRIVKELAKADMTLTIMATLVTSPKANNEKNLPIIWKSGAPGG